MTHQVLFSVSKGEKVFLRNKFLHSGDWFDPSFDLLYPQHELLYPQHEWVKEDVLHFYRKDFFTAGEQESMVVQNKTHEVIEFLRITSVDSFLLFNIQPNTTTTLIASAPRADNRWVAAEGQFDETSKIEQQGVGFLFPQGKKGPFTYYLYIADDALTTKSADLNTYKGTRDSRDW